MYEKLKPYIEKGLISEQTHPENSDIRIFNYTNQCQFEGAWDEITLQCRGLIIDVKQDKKLSNPFPKFFNYEEHIEKGLAIPNEEPVIFEKYDGSLGILYWVNDIPWIATRGSFTSDQAIWATKWFRDNIKSPLLEQLNKNWTYLFEIIYPENKIVVHYDFSGLVLVGIRELVSRVDNEFWITSQESLPFKIAKSIPSTDFDSLRKMEEPNKEGFVLFYPKHRLRLKIKFDEYKRLHKIITGLSALGIWESLSNGEDLKIENVPDEFFKWFNDTKEQLLKNYKSIEAECTQHFSYIKAFCNDREIGKENRGFWAERIKEMRYPSIGFAILDGKDYSKIIWKMVRPTGNQIFKTDI